jgi:hypothetical protein
MSRFPRKRAIAIGAAVFAVAAGGGAAVAATTSGSSPNDFLDSVARHLGISREKLDEATKAAAIDQVDARLKAGQITQAQAEELKKRIQNGDVAPLAALGGAGGPGGPGFGFGLRGGPQLLKAGISDSLAAAAKYLGLTESALRDQLGDGKSLADVAKAQNKDVGGLKDAILAAAKTDLDKAVSDKDLTQSQADDVYNRLKDRIDDMVNGQLRFDGPRLLHRGLGDDLSAAAKYLGLSERAVRDQLQDGKSLADVAKAQNKDVGGLKDAIIAAQKADLDKAVSDKRITQSQADRIYDDLKSHVDDLVNGKPGDFPALHGKRGGWFGP